MAQPKANKETVPKTVRMKTWMVEKIKERAKKENRNFSNMVETMLLEVFGS